MTRRDLVDDVLSASDEPPGPLTDESDAAAAADETDITPESSDDDLLDALGDDVSRSVLLACNRAPMTAEELAESCEVSESTIYRRLETLSSLGLVERTQRVDAPSKTCYETAVDGLSIHLGDGLRVEAGSSNYVVDAMRTLLAAIDVQQLAYDREQNSVDVRFRLVPTLLDSLVELYVRDTDSREK
ncbi:helix-turn-helix domain-containing protein [Haloferax volcanii]|uniref:Transcription regulator n=3 Tax=Haloferax volcanii TaxID=2246 RepID=A0A384KJ15_HALVD|nr:helix-turn-helix domain-containing protein [Haloferax volcanii]ADE02166.1 ArsR family transcription regulator [Haloferax volcanii DS2]ELY37373.1 transcription regulator [Haloferax volcanii DS2]MBS8120447.1 helix-turn-helix domain-containing protein [Haloferax volcanii]MBS8125484.1 helix-turn-helix domain-containing protein [Haloferax volcanii]MBS8129351.1 helix-turn-helix domain-containing protein [Haloferax volcanii]